MEASLTAKIKVLESNYSFLKKEHTLLLKGLHEEIERLQRKYSELAFDYTIRSNKSLESILLEDKINQLQSSLNEKNDEVKSQRENLNLAHTRHQERESKLMQQIDDQKNTIENLQYIISKQKNINIDGKDQCEKEEKPKKETQTEKVHRRKKKKSASFHAYDTGNSSILTPEKSPSKDQNSKTLATKSTKSATVTPAASPLIQSVQYSASESENNQKKGRRDRRSRKKNNTPPVYMGDVPILPSDYRAVVATLPPISQTQEDSTLACDMHNFVPCSSGRHSGFSAMKSDVSPLSQLHKGLRKPPLKVDSFN